MSASQQCSPCSNPACAQLMSHQYLCKGCKKPVHWFCVAGSMEVNKSKGHDMHYRCPPCHSKKSSASNENDAAGGGDGGSKAEVGSSSASEKEPSHSKQSSASNENDAAGGGDGGSKAEVGSRSASEKEPCPSKLKRPAPACNKSPSKRSRGGVAAGKPASKPASKRSRGEVAAGNLHRIGQVAR